jgi:hypothetical protein
MSSGNAVKRRRSDDALFSLTREDLPSRHVNHIFDIEYRNGNLEDGLFHAGYRFRQIMAEDRGGKAFKDAAASIRISLRKEFISWLERAERFDVSLSDLGRLFSSPGTPDDVGLLVIRLALMDLAKHFHIRVSKC